MSSEQRSRIRSMKSQEHLREADAVKLLGLTLGFVSSLFRPRGILCHSATSILKPKGTQDADPPKFT